MYDVAMQQDNKEMMDFLNKDEVHGWKFTNETIKR